MRKRHLVALLIACGISLPLLARREDPRPSFLIVTIDTLRADAAGRGRGTPTIEAFLDGATHFPRARTPAPLTLPAHVSLMSGLAPSRHGIHDNCAPPLPSPAARGFPLLAEEFRDAGYETAAFVAREVVAPRTGIDSGFASYDCPDYESAARRACDYLPAEKRVEAPLAWLAGRSRRRPFFAWVHFFDPHAPYLPFAGDALRPGTRAGDPPAALYQGEVRRVDAVLARLLAALPPNTIVILASDHGEALGENGERTHGTLCHAATCDVFLAIHAPGFTPGSMDTRPSSLCDIAPTLRALGRLAAQESDGAPLWEAPQGIVISESLLAWGVHGWGQCFSATDGRFTLVEAGPRLELFDLASDARESRPIDPCGHEAYEALDRALETMRGGSRTPGEGGDPVGAISPYGMTRRAFVSYLPRGENARLKDPRPRIPFWDSLDLLVTDLTGAADAGDVATIRQGIARIEAFVREDSDSPYLRFLLLRLHGWVGATLGSATSYARAAEAGRQAMERGYAQALVLFLTLHSGLRSERPDRLDAIVEAVEAAGCSVDAACAGLLREAADVLRGTGRAAAAQCAERLAQGAGLESDASPLRTVGLDAVHTHGR